MEKWLSIISTPLPSLRMPEYMNMQNNYACCCPGIYSIAGTAFLIQNQFLCEPPQLLHEVLDAVIRKMCTTNTDSLYAVWCIHVILKNKFHPFLFQNGLLW